MYSSNEEALVLQSVRPETRLTFINSSVVQGSVTPNFVLSASNENFLVRKDSTVIANFGIDYGQPLVYVPGTVKAPQFQIPADQASKKSVVLRDFNRVSHHQFAGFGYSNGRVEYQLPTQVGAHAFYASVTSDASLELMRVGTNGAGQAQVGIGTASVSSNVTLHVAGTTVVDGNLTVQGDLNFDRTGLVELDPSTSRISTSNLPNGLLYLDQATNKVDPTYLPQTYQFQYLRGQKNVGIGTRAPQQRFHVQGSGVFSERVGIGTFQPVARMHVREPSAIIPSMVLENNAGGNLLEARMMNSPVLTVVGTHVGVGIGTSTVAPQNALEVVGNSVMTGDVTCSNITILGSAQFGALHIEDDTQVYVQQSTITMDGITQTGATVYMPFVFEEGIGTSKITTTGAAPYVHFKDCGLRVDGEVVLATQMYVISDARLKDNIEVIPDSLDRVERLRGYTYTLKDGKKQVGLLAQEVMDILPQAVTKLPEDYYAVSYDSIIPLLVEAVRDLSQQLRDLKKTHTD